MINILLLHLSYIGIGLFVFRLLFGNSIYAGSIRIILSYFVGALVHNLVLHLAIVAMLTTQFMVWALVIIGLLALAFEIQINVKSQTLFTKSFAIQKELAIIYFFGALLLLPAIYLITLKLVGIPDVSYDTTAFWNLKAKYFFYDEHLWTDAFQNSDRIHPHQDYPLYIPIFSFEHFAVLGAPDDYRFKLGFWIYYCFGMMLFYILVKEWAGSVLAILAVALLLYSPLHSYNSIPGGISSTYVDFPLSIAIMASVGLFTRYLQFKNAADIFGAMVFLSTAVLLKREGVVWFIIFFPLFTFGIWASNSMKWKKEYIYTLFPVAVFGSWWLLRAQLPEVDSEFHLPKSIEDIVALFNVLPSMIIAWIRNILNYKIWGLMGIFVVVALFVSTVRNRQDYIRLIPNIMLLGYLGVIFLVIMLLVIQFQEDGWYWFTQRKGALIYRLLIHIHLAGLFLALIMNTDKFINQKEI